MKFKYTTNFEFKLHYNYNIPYYALYDVLQHDGSYISQCTIQILNMPSRI